MSIEIKPKQTKISKIWYYFEDTENYHIKRCKICGDFVAFVKKDHHNYLHDFLINSEHFESHYNQYLQLLHWAEKKDYKFYKPGPQDKKGCLTAPLALHLENKHPNEYIEFLSKRFHRQVIVRPWLSSVDLSQRMTSVIRFVLMTDLPIYDVFNKEGILFFDGLFSSHTFPEFLNFTYEMYLQEMISETMSSIPISVMIDEWKSPYFNFKILGIACNYICNDFQPKHKCLGIIKMNSGDSVTISRSTERCIEQYFGEDHVYPVTHDTCASMNAAYNIVIKETSSGMQIEEEENEHDDNEYHDEQYDVLSQDQQNVLDSIPDEIPFECIPKVMFRNTENVILVHQQCETHVWDLVMKKSASTIDKVNIELSKMNHIILKLKTSTTMKDWEIYCSENGIKCLKFVQLSNTRFYVHHDMIVQFVEYEYHIKKFFEIQGFEVIDKDDIRSSSISVSCDEKVIYMPETFEHASKTMGIIKQSQLILSSENTETLPHVIECLHKVSESIVTGLNNYGIELEINPVTRICEIQNKTMKFKRIVFKNGRRKTISCSIEIVKEKYKIKQSNRITEEGLELDALYLLALMFYTSSKYRHVLSNKRVLIASFLNPQTKTLIPIDYFQDQIMEELNQIKIHSKFTAEEEVYNYHLIKMENGINYRDYWDWMQYTFPRLYYLSIKYATFAATEISIERIFSICKEVHRAKRNKMQIDIFSKIVSLRYNLKKSSQVEIDYFFAKLYECLKNRIRYTM